MKIETDLNKIKEIAKKKEEENWDFRRFLKGYDMEIEEMDAIVHGYYEQVIKEIDCKECGNCCREISPSMEEGDIERMAKGLGMSPSDFESQYVPMFGVGLHGSIKKTYLSANYGFNGQHFIGVGVGRTIISR